MSTDRFAHIALDQIAPSLTNPRKTFDQTKLAELAESIKATGVHSPVLLRPLPAARLEDTAHLKPRPAYELVAGERRYRASGMAALATIPAMIRELTDDQVLEIQIIENLQRDDLSPLEEAEGYEALMKHSGLPAEAVGAKIGKSRSYVYNRLKLLDLSQEGREALRAGQIDASKGLLIARIPDTKLQAEALKTLVQTGNHGETMGFRQAQAYIQQRFMLALSGAKFKITDANLLPSAGSCRECPKRTGADPDLFADVKAADTCTDPACFHAKEQAHSDALKRTAHERGQTIIDGREAKALMPNGWLDTRVEGHLRLDDKADSPTDQPLRKLIGKVMAERDVKEVLVANPHKEGELIACLPTETVAELLQAASAKNTKAAEAAQVVSQNAERQAKHEAESAKAKAASEYETAWRWDMLETTWDHIKTGTAEPWDALLRHVALRFANSLNQDQCKRLCKLLELGKVAPKDGFVQWVKDVPDAHMALQLLVMFQEVEYHAWMDANQKAKANAGLFLVAEAYGVTADDIQSEVKRAMRAAAKAAKADKVPLPLPPAAQASGVRGGGDQSETLKGKNPGKRKTRGQAPAAPTMSAEDAMLGIAAAMQSQEAVAESGHGKAEPVGGAAAEGLNERPSAEEGDASESWPPAWLKVGARARVTDEFHFTGQACTVVTEPGRGGHVEVLIDGLQCGYMFAADELEPLPPEAEATPANDAPATAEAKPGTGAADPVYEAAKATVLTSGKASISYVQRKHAIGYNRAAAILQALEDEGLVTHMNEKGYRQVVTTEAA